MSNEPLQARAGRNSPLQSVAPEYDGIRAFNKKLPAALAPGAAIKIADGGDQLLSYVGAGASLGANAGAAVLSIEAQIRDPDGTVIQSDTQVLGPAGGPTSFNLTQLLPKGYSLWYVVTLTAGVYGNDAIALYELNKFSQLKSIGPTEIGTSLTKIVEAAPGHADLFNLIQNVIYNTDSINHAYEVYLSTPEGDFLVGGSSGVGPGALQTLLSGNPIALNEGESIKVKLLVPIATAGRAVKVIGFVNETNELDA